VEAKTLETQLKYNNDDSKLEKEDSFTDKNEQETSRESLCCHVVDGE
jgi:hypothetical protein